MLFLVLWVCRLVRWFFVFSWRSFSFTYEDSADLHLRFPSVQGGFPHECGFVGGCREVFFDEAVFFEVSEHCLKCFWVNLFLLRLV